MSENKKIKAKSIRQVVEILLKNRGVKSQKGKEEFLNPPSPKTLTAEDVGIDSLQLNKAIERIRQSIEKKEKIIVYGDYDVDGVCASAILWETLRSLGSDSLPYIPSRFSEGYGLNIESIKKLKEEDPDIKLIITVDNGIVAHEKVNFAKSLGVDVIITDHHVPGAALPNAYSIVHTTSVSGSAVSWFLSRELLRKLKFKTSQSERVHFKFADDHLGLAALGTVADVLPLVGHNRSIVKHGLEALRKTGRIGLKALYDEAGIKQELLETFHIGFVIAPRMNAMGRLEHAMESLRLLCTKDPVKARTLALNLGRTNKIRQEKTESIIAHIQENFDLLWSQNLPNVLIASHESYDEGIVGIVAGRLVEKYYRPSIVVSKGMEISKASARSIGTIDIIQMIRQVGEGILLNAGGHPMAAGFSLKTSEMQTFQDKLIKYSASLQKEIFAREEKVDCEIDFSLLTFNLYKELLKFEPFGFGNPTPTFKSTNVAVEDVRLMGKDNNHLKLQLSQEDFGEMEAVGFRMGELYSKLSPGANASVVYSIEENSWRGRTTLQLKLKSLTTDGLVDQEVEAVEF